MHVFFRFVTVFLIVMPAVVTAQTIEQKLKAAFEQFEKDPQLKYAISSLYVIEETSGKVVFQKNAFQGLAPASTQKVVTSITALALLGADYRYKTEFSYDPQQKILHIAPSGDPTLGSTRYGGTNADHILAQVINKLPKDAAVKSIQVDNAGWEKTGIPEGWIWQDLANYYGAAAEKLNWRENKYELVLQSGKAIGDPVKVLRTKPDISSYFTINSLATAAARGTGDNAYIFFPTGSAAAVVKGTIPVNENNFTISGALPSAGYQMARELADTIGSTTQKPTVTINSESAGGEIFHISFSPALDSIVYWFNRRSINLYGEAMLASLATEKKLTPDSGLAVLKSFWKENGIDPLELNMQDGSGLSPVNRITTHAQVELLRFARKQPWFQSFYTSLPDYNGMKMKSGTIRYVKGFTGYHTAANGTRYIFSFLVNNYNGGEKALVGKMFKVLNTLK